MRPDIVSGALCPRRPPATAPGDAGRLLPPREDLDHLLETNEFRAAVGGGWTFLSHPGRSVQKDLDIAEYTDPDHNSMIPHTRVLEPGLRVYKTYNGYRFSASRPWNNCVTISGTCCSAVVRIGTLAD